MLDGLLDLVVGVILKRTINISKQDGSVKVATNERANPEDECFPISTFALRDREQRRALEYAEAMDEMGWIDLDRIPNTSWYN
jgi:hypothetical protein